MPRFPGLKIFVNGVSNAANFSASEYRDMLKVMVCAVAGTFSDDPGLDRAVTHVFVTFNEWYLRCRAVYHTPQSLRVLKRAASAFLASLHVFEPVTGGLKDGRKIKFHNILHFPLAIELFGRVKNFVCEAFEKAHKGNAKKPADRTNLQVHFPYGRLKLS